MTYKPESIYEIVVESDTTGQYDSNDLYHENPLSTHDALKALRRQLGNAELTILRDNHQITEAELSSDVTSYEVQTFMEAECHLPSVYRRGRGGDSDLTAGNDGQPVAVWKPKNPEDG